MTTIGDNNGEAELSGDTRKLVDLACESGATAAIVIPGSNITVEDHLAKLCKEPGCPNYSLSCSCPPNHGGPEEFRALLLENELVVFFKIDVPTEILMSSDRQDLMRLTHEIASGVELAALSYGFERARGFAGGSCKHLFCGDHLNCRVVDEGGECRFPDSARQSMSGFGINVGKLMKRADWPMWTSASDDAVKNDSTGALCGLILLG